WRLIWHARRAALPEAVPDAHAHRDSRWRRASNAGVGASGRRGCAERAATHPGALHKGAAMPVAIRRSGSGLSQVERADAHSTGSDHDRRPHDGGAVEARALDAPARDSAALDDL